MSLRYKYSVDVFNYKHISGWCCHRLHRRRPVVLNVYLDTRLLGTVTADDYREDLHQQKMHPTGKCGFRFILPPEVNERGFGAISVCPDDSKTPLFNLYPEDRFRVLGRSRSPKKMMQDVLGLWGRRRPAIFFMHIPKTAGTSFNTFARSIFPPHSAISHIKAYRPEEFAGLQHRYRYISGHLRIGEIKAGFELQDLKLYTIIREPYRQLHSHLNWLRHVTDRQDQTFFQQHNDLMQAVALKCSAHDFSCTAGVARFVADLSDSERRVVDNCQARYFLDGDPDQVGPEHQPEILRNLQLFAGIGVTERYAEFQQAFARAYSRKPVADQYRRAMNASRRKPLFDVDDPEICAALGPLVEVDRWLYRQVTGVAAP